MGDDAQQRPVRVCLTRCPLAPADESVHSLPCHIHHDGTAAIKSYFRPEQESEGDHTSWRAEFRGVQLRGQRVSLQAMGMQGLVLEDAGMTHADDEGRIWEVDNHFDEMTFWQVPNSGDEDTNLPVTLTAWTALAHAMTFAASLSTVKRAGVPFRAAPSSRLVTPATGSWSGRADERKGDMRANPRRRRHGRRSPRLLTAPVVSSSSPSTNSSGGPPLSPPALPLLARMPTTTRPTASPSSSSSSSRDGTPLAAEVPSSSFSNPHAGEEAPSRLTTSRHGTKRPRDSNTGTATTTTTMCRRGSADAGDRVERVVVALAPRSSMKSSPSPTTSTTTAMTRASLAFAAATASAHVVTHAHTTVQALDQTIRARVQRLLVQFVMLPVVWVSLCCVITAAMGIEAMESIHKALVQDQALDSSSSLEPPTKRTKRNAPSDDDQLPRPPTRRGELLPPSDEDCGLVFKLKNSPSAPEELVAPAAPPPRRRRRRRVLIWDLDETLVLFASLYSGAFARTHDKDLATSVVLGEQMMTYLVAVLERHFFFSDLHNTDIDHISGVSDSVPAIAERYARIQAIYERRSATPVDFLDDPTSQWFTARQAIVTSIDTLSTGWIREAHELLALTQAAGEDDEIINVMVTNTQLSPALCKCLLYRLDAYFPIDCVYSSSKLHKMQCFQTIMAKYAAPEDDSDVEFVAIGDGLEEEQVSQALGLPFCKIGSLDDLRDLRYELQLVETPVMETKTLATSPSPVASPSTAQCP